MLNNAIELFLDMHYKVVYRKVRGKHSICHEHKYSRSNDRLQ